MLRQAEELVATLLCVWITHSLEFTEMPTDMTIHTAGRENELLLRSSPDI